MLLTMIPRSSLHAIPLTQFSTSFWMLSDASSLSSSAAASLAAAAALSGRPLVKAAASRVESSAGACCCCCCCCCCSCFGPKTSPSPNQSSPSSMLALALCSDECFVLFGAAINVSATAAAAQTLIARSSCCQPHEIQCGCNSHAPPEALIFASAAAAAT